MKNEALDWTAETVTWGEAKYDVSSEACSVEPLLNVLRHEARKFDEARESVHQYAREVARYATEIAEAADHGYMPQHLHHQRPSDLNDAVTKMKVIAETIHAITNVLDKARA